MKDFLAFLNQNVGALSVIFTAVVTISTVIYAALTAKLVTETRQMREVQTEPRIHITIESLDYAINLVRLNIKNIGLGPARNVHFSPAVIAGGDSANKLLNEFTESNFFKTGLRHFGPGQNIFSQLTESHKDFEGKSASVLSFTLEYEGVTGKKYKDEIVVDMSEIKSNYQLGKPHLYAIAQSLEKIQKDLGNMTSGFKRLKADVFSNEDRIKEREEQNNRIEEQRRAQQK